MNMIQQNKSLKPNQILISLKFSLISIIVLSINSVAFAKLPSFLNSVQKSLISQKPIQGKKTVCTATLNSSDEKNIFEKKLAAADFQFVELTLVDQWAPETDKNKSWFDRACESKIKCDIMITSGHFAGTFFGESGLTLSSSELESHSCRQDCSGILSNPKEVFLFGCNTLATKEADARTREQYIKVLLDDGFTQAQAEQIAEGRYGLTGEQNKDRMRRSFLNVPYIYGFKTKAPLGPDIAPALANYLDQNQPYANHIDQIVQNPIQNADNAPNVLLQENLKNIRHQGLSQCAGLSGLNPNDPYYQININMCQFHTLISDLSAKIKFAEGLMNSKDGAIYLPAIIEYFVSYDGSIQSAASQALQQFKVNQHSKDLYIKYLPVMKTPVLRSEWLVFGKMMGWISDSDYTQKALSIYSDLLQLPLNSETSGSVCSLKFKGPYAVDNIILSKLININHFNNYFGLQSVYCLNVLETESTMNLLNSAIKTAALSQNSFVASLIGLLDKPSLQLNLVTTKVMDDILPLCVSSNSVDVLQACLNAVNNLKYKNSAVIDIAQRAIGLSGNIDSALKYLSDANIQFYGSEALVVARMKLQISEMSLKIFGEYFIKFPLKENINKTEVLNHCQKIGVTACETLIESIQDLQINEQDYLNLLNSPSYYRTTDGWKSLLLISTSQQIFTTTMAEILFKDRIYTGGQNPVVSALKLLLDNIAFQNAVVKSPTAFTNLCTTIYDGNTDTNSPFDCFNSVANWKISVTDQMIVKDVALTALDSRNMAKNIEALKFLIKIKSLLNADDKNRLRGYINRPYISALERETAQKALQ